ncbi:hypothetical protein H8B13_01565 [Hymenobacter sp. BT188]|nr:hypothetical protein [Hymenobacter sp. BT188]
MTSFYSRLYLVVMLNASVFIASAQTPESSSPSTLQLGIGTAGMGTGDYVLLKAQVEYGRLFKRHLSTGTRLALAGGNRENIATVYNSQRPGGNGVNVPYALSYQTANLEQEFYIYPFGNDKEIRFFAGGGGYVGYSTRYGAPANHLNFTTNEATLDLDHEEGWHAGYMFSINLDLALGSEQNWRVGGKASFQNDTFANSLASLQFNVGRRF